MKIPTEDSIYLSSSIILTLIGNVTYMHYFCYCRLSDEEEPITGGEMSQVTICTRYVSTVEYERLFSTVNYILVDDISRVGGFGLGLGDLTLGKEWSEIP